MQFIVSFTKYCHEHALLAVTENTTREDV